MTYGDGSSKLLAPLKRDAISRVRSTPQQRQTALDAYARSGLSGPQFARTAGIKYQTLVTWLRQAKAAASLATAPHPAVHFMEAVPMRATPSAALELLLPGGGRLPLSCPAQMPLAAALLRELELNRL